MWRFFFFSFFFVFPPCLPLMGGLLSTYAISSFSCKKNTECGKLCLPPVETVKVPQDPGEEK